MRLTFLVAATLVAGSLVARAETFNFQNLTFADGATGAGIVEINTTTGQFGNLNLTIQDGVTTYVFNSAISSQGQFVGLNYFGYWYDPAGDLVLINLPVTSLAGYSGGSICGTAVTADCDGYGYLSPNGGAPDVMKTGSLAPAATPEPASFVLLGSGVLGLARVIRRRVG